LNTLNLSDREYVLANGVKEDADKVWAVMKDKATPVPGIVIEATASVIKVAVSQDAKDAKVADFIVNLKTPLADKDVPVAGVVYGLASKGEAELDGTYDSYSQVPATATTAQTAQIVLREGSIQAKKAAAPAHKPAAGHKAH
jgi:S1-C subfamily serine protease